jgi:outer membrane protein
LAPYLLTFLPCWLSQQGAKKARFADLLRGIHNGIALNGVREEARVGQRATPDVLNAQQEIVNARVALVTAQHDRLVAPYTLLAAVGSLSMQRFGLNVQPRSI